MFVINGNINFRFTDAFKNPLSFYERFEIEFEPGARRTRSPAIG